MVKELKTLSCVQYVVVCIASHQITTLRFVFQNCCKWPPSFTLSQGEKSLLSMSSFKVISIELCGEPDKISRSKGKGLGSGMKGKSEEGAVAVDGPPVMGTDGPCGQSLMQ